jgi:hypothetical protein
MLGTGAEGKGHGAECIEQMIGYSFVNHQFGSGLCGLGIWFWLIVLIIGKESRGKSWYDPARG